MCTTDLTKACKAQAPSAGLLLSVLTALSTAGCLERAVSLRLATLPSKETIHIRETGSWGTVHTRDVVLRLQDGSEAILSAAAGDRSVGESLPSGFDVRRTRDVITVWRISGTEEIPLASLDVDADGAPRGSLRGPGADVTRAGTTLGCRIRRVLAEAPVDTFAQLPERIQCEHPSLARKAETVCLTMFSARDSGAETPDANFDRVTLSWHRKSPPGSVSTEVMALEGAECVPDPFSMQPNVEIRWDWKREAAWVVDLETGRVLSGFKLGTWFFGSDGTPGWATAETGTVVASTHRGGASTAPAR